MMNRRAAESGNITTVSIVLVLGMTLLGTTAVQLVRNHSAFSPGRDEMQEVEMLRSTIMQLLDCRRTLELRDDGKLVPCDSRQFILKDFSGTPIFPASGNEMTVSAQSAAGTTAPYWNLRAVCRENQLVIERKTARAAASSSIFASYGGLWPRGKEPRLCESYFRVPPSCVGDYGIYAGFDDDGPTCCRMVTNSGVGSAAAICRETEYLIAGGGYCSESSRESASQVVKETKEVKRCLLDAKALATQQIGSGSAVGVTMTNPSLGFPPVGTHVDTALPALMAANVTYPRSKSMLKTNGHGGFLLQNGHTFSAASLTVDGWVSACKMDDWEEAFGTTAVGFCCPKRRQ
jgi:hypothetical protein